MRSLAKQKSFRVAAATFGLLTLAGCTFSSSGADQPSDNPTVPQLLEARDLKLPLQKFLPTDADLDTIANAEGLLTRACMVRLGVKNWHPAAPPAGFRRVGMAERRYGVANAAEAAKYGYDLPPEVGWQPPVDFDTEVQLTGGRGGGLTMPGGQPVIFNGHLMPVGGCRGAARKYLSGEIEAIGPEPAISRLDSETFGLSLQDGRVSAVLDAWSSCMSAAGYSYKTPMQPIADRRAKLRELSVGHDISIPFVPPPASAEEMAAATTDVECKGESNLVGIWFSVETEIQEQLIAEHAEELKTAVAAFANTVNRAQQVIADPATATEAAAKQSEAEGG